MAIVKKIFLVATLCISFLNVLKAQEKPNILWILTDDQRYDAIPAFNKMLHGRENSELGYVESPNVDRLSEMGTTFINTYCQAQGCAPSRATMHYGRYPFRTGIYEFEYHNNKVPHAKPTLPEQMEKLGYQTVHFGKLGVRIKTLENGKLKPHEIYQNSFYFKDLAKEGLTDWGKGWANQFNGQKLEKPIQNLEFVVTADGEFKYYGEEIESLFPEIAGTSIEVSEKYDFLRHYSSNSSKSSKKGMIISGVSPQPEGKTRDGVYASLFVDFLNNENKSFNVGKLEYNGVDTSKPLFCHIGFDFPHTPVLPPKSYRDKFQKHTYKIPEFDVKEFEKMPKQIKNGISKKASNHFTNEEKQKMVQDYYAFCAYGDALIGQAVDEFITYSESNDQPWMVVYVCGDHGWKLNDHGAISKFTPWEMDAHNPIIVVSSDKNKFPNGKVVRDFTEFVDIAPTILSEAGANLNTNEFSYLDGLDLKKIASGEAPKRDYVIGESHAVIGPRAFIRTEKYLFSIKTRPNKNKGELMDWALNASYIDLDPALYNTLKDPKELNNLAFDKEYELVAKTLKEKLLNIVLGDNRAEVNWKKWGSGTEVFYSNFATGAHDYKLKVK